MSDQVSGVSVDGQVRVRVRKDGVFITVTAPEGQGRTVSLPLVERALAEREIVDVDWAAVQTALQEKSGRPVLVAPRHPNLDRDAKVFVEMGTDYLQAFLVIERPLGGRRITAADALGALRAAGVTDGLDQAAIEAAVASQGTGSRFLVASARTPVDGTDGYLQYRFDVDGLKARPQELEDGRVDYYHLGVVQSATPGQVLAVRVPPTKGVPGVTVTGQPLTPKPGRDVRLPKGKNTEVGSDSDTLVAQSTGQIVVIAGKVNVLPVYDVRGDIDFSTGNIDFVGSVTVGGTVRSGFTVRATGNVEVKGSVEAAAIIADGDIVVRGGVQGGDRGRLAGRNVCARFIQNCRVEATGDVLVEEALMYGDVSAQGRVEAKGSRGRIVGGTVRAVREVAARVIGSKLGTHTEIMVGVNPEIRGELDRLGQELAARERQLDEVVKAVRLIKEAVAAGRPVPGGDPGRFGKLASAMTELNEQVESLRHRRNELAETVATAGQGNVRATEIMYSGVRLSIGPLTTLVQDEVAKAVFRIEEGEIRQGIL